MIKGSMTVAHHLEVGQLLKIIDHEFSYFKGYKRKSFCSREIKRTRKALDELRAALADLPAVPNRRIYFGDAPKAIARSVDELYRLFCDAGDIIRGRVPQTVENEFEFARNIFWL